MSNKIRNIDHFYHSDDSGESASGRSLSETSEERDTNDFCDQFFVDKKKLEHMLFCYTEEKCDRFFQRIMSRTNTSIDWPINFRSNSKLEPQIRITGTVENVETAKLLVLDALDGRMNRITMKIDVPHNEHSHIIGKAGISIKRVMEETRCHIHFPDSNRTSQEEKSNQVSIAGDASGVELARKRLREMQQLEFTFEVPVTPISSALDVTDPHIRKIASSYEIQISYDTKSNGYSVNPVYTTKGLVRNADKVKTGTQELIEYLTPNFQCIVLVTTTIELSPQHQNTIFGKDNNNLHRIMNKTGAFIHASDSVNLRRSTLYIQGTIESVYSARQHIIGLLPIVVMFDTKNDVDLSLVNHIMEELDCTVQIKNKVKQGTKSLIVKSSEKNVSVCFEVRKRILQLDEPNPAGDVPVKVMNADYGFSEFSNYCPVNTMPPAWTASPLYYVYHALQQQSMAAHQLLQQQHLITPVIPNGDGNARSSPPERALDSSGGSVPGAVEHRLETDERSPNNDYWVSPERIDGCQHAENRANEVDLSGSMKANSLMDLVLSRNNDEQVEENLSSSNSSSNTITQMDAVGILSPSIVPSSSSSKLTDSGIFNEVLLEYDRKKILASKAIDQTVGPAVRVPTNAWSGLGFSRSMPGHQFKEFHPHNSPSNPASEDALCSPPDHTNRISKHGAPGDPRRIDSLSASNYFDAMPTRSSRASTLQSGRVESVTELLSRINLTKYSDVFRENEIDMATFLRLTNEDLQELNISFGARKRILVAISETQKLPLQPVPEMVW